MDTDKIDLILEHCTRIEWEMALSLYLNLINSEYDSSLSLETFHLSKEIPTELLKFTPQERTTQVKEFAHYCKHLTDKRPEWIPSDFKRPFPQIER